MLQCPFVQITRSNTVLLSALAQMAQATPFEIHVSDELLELTRKKLELSRLPDQLLDVEWEGTELPEF